MSKELMEAWYAKGLTPEYLLINCLKKYEHLIDAVDRIGVILQYQKNYGAALDSMLVLSSKLSIRWAPALGYAGRILTQWVDDHEETWDTGFYKKEKTVLKKAERYCQRNGIDWSRVEKPKKRTYPYGRKPK